MQKATILTYDCEDIFPKVLAIMLVKRFVWQNVHFIDTKADLINMQHAAESKI